MNILKRQTINILSIKHPRAKQHLEVWYNEARKAKWKNPSDILQLYPKASILKQKRVVFNILGGEYRLIVKIEYEYQVLFILFFGTHQEYEKIDADTINMFK